jgi:hypothetical protein
MGSFPPIPVFVVVLPDVPRQLVEPQWGTQSVIDLGHHVMKIDPNASALLQQGLDELGIRDSPPLALQRLAHVWPSHRRFQELPHVRQVLWVFCPEPEPFDAMTSLDLQRNFDRTLGDDQIDSRR